MKKIAVAFILSISACGDPDAATERALAAAEDRAADDGKIECAVEGAEAFERLCTMERMKGPDGTTLTLRHPNGGFRRLSVTTDGRGVVAADGADPAIVSVASADRIEVSLAGDRYRLPATIKSGSR